MTWLAPLYLLAAASIAAPIIFHLWRRTPQQTRLFSSVLFLTDSLPRRTSQSRIDAWPLLMLRIGALCLLAIAFARPVWTMAGGLQGPAEPEHWSVLLVDTSASLQRAGLMESVRREAAQWLDTSNDEQTAPRERIARSALYTFSDHLIPLVPLPTAQLALTGNLGDTSRSLTGSGAVADWQEIIFKLEAGERGGPLGPAVIELTNELEQFLATRPGRARATLTVISDFSVGNELTALGEGTSSKQVTLRALPVTAALTSNASLQPIQGLSGDPEDLARVLVSANPDCTAETLTVHWQTSAGEQTSTLTVPPGRTRTLTIRGLPTEVPSRVWLTGDDHPFDNAVYLPVRQPPTLRVQYAGFDDVDDPQQGAFYWWGVLDSMERYRIVQVPQSSAETQSPATPRVSAQTAAQGLAAAPNLIAQPQLVLWDDPRAADAATVQSWLQNGTFVLSVPATADDATQMLRSLDCSATVKEVVPPKYALLGQLDFTHPWLAPFREARFADFSGIHVWKYRHVTFNQATTNQPDALMKFDDGSPALLWKTVGQGAWAMLLTDWAPADSQLARSTKFAPLLLKLADLSAAHLNVQSTLQTGNVWPSTDQHGEALRLLERVVTPGGPAEGTAITIDVQAAPCAERTGHYRLISEVSNTTALSKVDAVILAKPDAAVLAVNLPASEGRTTPITSEELLAAGWLLPERPSVTSLVASTSTAATTASTAQSGELGHSRLNKNQTRGQEQTEQSQRLWQWGLFLVLILLIVEGIWTGQRTWKEHQRSPSDVNGVTAGRALRSTRAGEVS